MEGMEGRKPRLIVKAGRPLCGFLQIEAAKNAILPLMAAALLADGKLKLRRVPPLQDVLTMGRVLTSLGAGFGLTDQAAELEAGNLMGEEPPYELVRAMRASFLVMAPLVTRLGRAVLALPGGCAIGNRPVALHLKGMEALGAKVTWGNGKVSVEASKLMGNRIYLDYPSVGATETLLLAACTARGETWLDNAAEEPEVVDLANCLNLMGAHIQGAGTKMIRIEGVRWLQGTTHTPIPDRIEAGTYLIAACLTGGEVTLENVIPEHLHALSAKLQQAGAQVESSEGRIRVRASRPLNGLEVVTMPYPGFPTDLQAPLFALLALARGTSVVSETVFENRYLHVGELRRMGAQIRVEGRAATICGVESLSGAPVRAPDLRAAAALVLAGLRAEGETEVTGLEHLERGYYRLEEKLVRLGADIRREE